ncbi:hypothetical protein DL96DRAFT_483503 [Flagelloscypha sp. PMI_526]|nr:hypothetical protein DL96DRAFT_483503 [Flagelloscypha sp. PMI_526]
MECPFADYPVSVAVDIEQHTTQITPTYPGAANSFGAHQNGSLRFVILTVWPYSLFSRTGQTRVSAPRGYLHLLSDATRAVPLTLPNLRELALEGFFFKNPECATLIGSFLSILRPHPAISLEVATHVDKEGLENFLRGLSIVLSSLDAVHLCHVIVKHPPDAQTTAIGVLDWNPNVESPKFYRLRGPRFVFQFQGARSIDVASLVPQLTTALSISTNHVESLVARGCPPWPLAFSYPDIDILMFRDLHNFFSKET